MSTTTALQNKQHPGSQQAQPHKTQHHPQKIPQTINQQTIKQAHPSQQTQRSQLIHQSNIPATTSLKNSINLQQHQQQLPPRYQPPPQAPNGILKHLSGPGNQTKSSVPTLIYPTELNPHISLKYPPDIPKLSQIQLPDNLKNQSRLIQPQRTRYSTGNIPVPAQQNTLAPNNHRPLHRLPSSSETSSASDETQQQHQQPLPPPPPIQPNLNQAQPQSRIPSIHQPNNQDMLKFVRKPDTDSASSTSNSTTATNGTSNGPNGTRMSDQNRHLQSLIGELRALKEANARLSDDNQELRDLCCFLDDDRQKGRKLAREWQRFGRYTASVMRQEVSAYQNKLRQLDDKQQELIRDNLELKELCLYLDEERTNSRANALCSSCGANVGCTGVPLRDDGDGSSSSTNADEPMTNRYTNGLSELNIRPSLGDQTLQYVRSLENKIRELEEGRATGISQADRPEAVVRALQVLEVREQLERERIGGTNVTQEQLDDGEKALVREMCNVVWRKLEENNTPIDHI